MLSIRKGITTTALVLLPSACTVPEDTPSRESLETATQEVYTACSEITDAGVLPSVTSTQLAPWGYGEIGAADAGYSPNFHHIVKRPAVSSPDCGTSAERKLVVFFPGCVGNPEVNETDYEAFLTVALNQGFHVIGLNYYNKCDHISLCDDDACPGHIRADVAFGVSSGESSLMAGHEQDSIGKRLKALLRYLHHVLDPQGKWDEFMVTDTSAPEDFRPAYDKIVFAGHSLGAGYAAFYGNLHDVHRVVMLAGPHDTGAGTSTSSTATWIENGFATDTSRFWGLVHQSDNAILGSGAGARERNEWIEYNWSEIGVPGADAGANQRGWVGTNTLASCAPDGGTTASKAHNAVATCSDVYENRWKQLLGTPAD